MSGVLYGRARRQRVRRGPGVHPGAPAMDASGAESLPDLDHGCGFLVERLTARARALRVEERGHD